MGEFIAKQPPVEVTRDREEQEHPNSPPEDPAHPHVLSLSEVLIAAVCAPRPKGNRQAKETQNRRSCEAYPQQTACCCDEKIGESRHGQHSTPISRRLVE